MDSKGCQTDKHSPSLLIDPPGQGGHMCPIVYNRQ